ncbi:hypothetical protein [Rothia mucilaginosa]|uniref:hypothetical protein n=1 Tax=Rothia mucilaginosa TaxID=43675 RepID=UPI0028E2460B|nr:hypothetical protein [Rothia mucilaginosa]
MADTPEKSGLSPDEQISSSTNSSSSVDSEANSVKSSAKKYDLGVLCVHGIGRQAPGDTFKAVYPAVINELKSDKSIIVKEDDSKTERINDLYLKISDGGNDKSILFREVYWHGEADNIRNNNPIYATKIESSSNSVDGEWCEKFKKCIKIFANFFLGIFWGIHILCLKFSRLKLGTPIFFVSLVFGFLFFTQKYGHDINMLTQAVATRHMSRVAVVVAVPVYLSVFILSGYILSVFARLAEGGRGIKAAFETVIDLLSSRWKKYTYILLCCGYILWAIIYVIWGQSLSVAVVCGVAFFLMVWFVSKVDLGIKELWLQINESADYIRSKDASNYIDFVKEEIEGVLRESRETMLIAHSMGEYLSYSALLKSKEPASSKVRLVSVGGGLGAVLLVGKLRVSNKQGGYSLTKSFLKSFYIALRDMLIFLLFMISWVGFSADLWGFINTLKIDNPIYLIVHLLGIVSSFIFVKLVVYADGISLPEESFKFYRYSHFWDPVGNFSNYAYSSSVKTSITPRFHFGHGLNTYFWSGNPGLDGTIGRYLPISMKYMQQQIVYHFKNLIYGNGIPNAEAAKFNIKGANISKTSLKYLFIFFVVLLGEFGGIFFGFYASERSGVFVYEFSDICRYMAIFSIFAYWAFCVFYKVLNIQLGIDYLNGNELELKFWMFLSLGFFVVMIVVYIASVYGWSAIVNVIDIIVTATKL